MAALSENHRTRRLTKFEPKHNFEGAQILNKPLCVKQLLDVFDPFIKHLLLFLLLFVQETSAARPINEFCFLPDAIPDWHKELVQLGQIWDLHHLPVRDPLNLLGLLV